MKKIKVKILKMGWDENGFLKEHKLNECGEPPPEFPDLEPEAPVAPVIGIGVDDEPCGCPDMVHNHNNNEGSMARSQLMHMKNYAEDLIHMITDQDDLPEWLEYKITLANDYIAKVKHYLDGHMAREQGMLENKKR